MGASYCLAGGAIASAAGSIYSGISSYSSSQDQADAMERQALLESYGYEMQAQAALEQAGLQAGEYRKQANVERIKSGFAQYQGDVEAVKRSMRLAQDIGSTYANWAGNGLMVDGSRKDTLSSVIKTQVTEGQADIGAIKDTAKMNVWTYQQNARALDASANYALVAAENEAAALRYAAQTGVAMAGINAGITRQAGLNSLIGSFVGSSGSLASGIGGAKYVNKW